MADRLIKKAGISCLLLMAFLSWHSSCSYAAVDPTRGAFLLAAETLVDPRFRQSVILLIEHGPTGSVGLVVNKTLGMTLEHAIAGLPAEIAGDQPLHYGGPVDPSVVWVLFATNQPPAASVEILPGLHAANAAHLFKGDFTLRTEQLRVFSGYAGWAPGQLELEIERGDWKVSRGRKADVFDDDPESLWEYLTGKALDLLI